MVLLAFIMELKILYYLAVENIMLFSIGLDMLYDLEVKLHTLIFLIIVK